MLIPQKECTNRFRIKATGEMTDFYIGSDDLLSLRFMKFVYEFGNMVTILMLY